MLVGWLLGWLVGWLVKSLLSATRDIPDIEYPCCSLCDLLFNNSFGDDEAETWSSPKLKKV